MLMFVLLTDKADDTFSAVNPISKDTRIGFGHWVSYIVAMFTVEHKIGLLLEYY